MTTPLLAPSLLIVEDNQDAAELFAELLEHIGYKTSIAFNAAEALEYLDKAPEKGFAAAFIDLHLPDMSGVELAGLVRAGRVKNSLFPLLIIGMTGLAPSDMDAVMMDKTFDYILHKPFDGAQLDDMVSILTNVQRI